MKSIFNMRILIIMFAVLIASSCSTVKRNGYYQTKNYRHGYAKKIFPQKPNKDLHDVKLSKISAHFNETDRKKVSLNQGMDYSVERSCETGDQIQGDIYSLTARENERSLKDRTAPKLRLTKKTRSFTKKVFPVLSMNSALHEHHLTVEQLSSNLTPSADERTVHWAAIVGLSAGVLAWFVAGLLFSICAIVFSAIALSKIGKESETYKGKGMAIAGLVLGILALLIMAIYVGMVLATL